MTDRLEEELAHITRAVEDLHEMVVGQGKRLDVMERRVEMLMKRAAESESDNTGGVVLGDERPPHY
ncbi:SlyX family protein [Vannielia litorea]|uniref:SlyX family protein n=1 Tax=Vannielia TaxID=2813041 RepID=UPI001C93DBA8|nr:SlyX family protein [Vannielia litorea]MBY6046277.1 SlyX family protein [Vannielia litorea]MBY6073690.1 SlyX family protein [Vannielia litorea]MBY6153836.1 SlyX family protein [Vannielia litorea]